MAAEGVHPVQEFAYPTVWMKLVQAGEQEDDMLAPQLCGHGEGCDVSTDGWKPCGVVLGVEGVNPLQQRRYRCKTHCRVFSVTDAAFCAAAYNPENGFTWDKVQPEPLVVKHGQTYMTAELLWDIITQFKCRTTINQIVDIIQQRWRGVYAQHARNYVLHHQQQVSYVL
ncbi:hypothetical protein COO60DRAFT_1067857 [Scenedesmus sp. NREL 46B-D3]|nr:hypothetical protein COO60DRAFT_1067857 [Scenedesmus sp. NREL 46B-D3]